MFPFARSVAAASYTIQRDRTGAVFQHDLFSLFYWDYSAQLARYIHGHAPHLCRCYMGWFAALYAMETVMKIIKRPQKEGRQSAPTKWILVGHSLGGLAANIVSY